MASNIFESEIEDAQGLIKRHGYQEDAFAFSVTREDWPKGAPIAAIRYTVTATANGISAQYPGGHCLDWLGPFEADLLAHRWPRS